MITRFVCTIVLTSLMSSCSDTGPKEIVGGVVMGGGAGYGCARFVKGRYAEYITAGCTLGGAIIGSQIGRSLDHGDDAYARPQTAPVAQQPTTVNFIQAPAPTPVAPVAQAPVSLPAPADVHSYYTQCRRFSSMMLMGDTVQKNEGVACQTLDGRWVVQ